MKFLANKYEPQDIYKFVRQATGKKHEEFCQDIGKQVDWSKSAETGRLNFKFIDFLNLCKKNNIKIIIQDEDVNL